MKENEHNDTWNAAIEAAAKKASDIATLLELKHHQSREAIGALEVEYVILSLKRPPSTGPTDMERFCLWTFDSSTGSYGTSCEKKYQFSRGGIKENGINFCPFCGRKIPDAAIRPELKEEK
jgi:hypothetical protein